MPEVSIFYPPRIDKVQFSKHINCTPADKAKLVALEETRRHYTEMVSNKKSESDQILEAGSKYIQQLSSYVRFCDGVNDKNDQEYFKQVFLKPIYFTHRSLLNEKEACFTESKMEMYMMLFQQVATQIDLQFKIVAENASADVLRSQNDYLKRALGICQSLTVMSRDISIQKKDVTEVAMELRTEIIENVQYLIQGIYCINAIDQALDLNANAVKEGEPIKYSYDSLAGFARTGENLLKAAHYQFETILKNDLKNLNPNYIAFVISMHIILQMYKLMLYYMHYYDVSIAEESTNKQVEEADQQKKLLGSQMKNLFEKIGKVKFKNTAVDAWFGQRFSKRVEQFQKITEKAYDTPGIMLHDIGTPVVIKPVEFSLPEPLWTELNINAPQKLKQLPDIPGEEKNDKKTEKVEKNAKEKDQPKEPQRQVV